MYFVVCIDVLFCMSTTSDCVTFITFQRKQYRQSTSFIHFLYPFLKITSILTLLNGGNCLSLLQFKLAVLNTYTKYCD